MQSWLTAITTLSLDDMVSVIFLFDHDITSDIYVIESLQKAESRNEMEGLFSQYMLTIQASCVDFLEVLVEVLVLIRNYRLCRVLGYSKDDILRKGFKKINPVKKRLYLMADNLKEKETYQLIHQFTGKEEIIDRYLEETLCRWQLEGMINIGIDMDSSSLGNIEKYIETCANKVSADKSCIITRKSCIENESEFYPIIKTDDVGFCLILNNSTFTENPDLKHLMPESPLPARPGSEKDVEAIIKTFRWLNFTIDYQENLTFAELKRLFSFYSKSIPSHHSIFVLVFMSHGMDAVVYSSDSVPINVDTLEMAFQRNSCPALAGKPKIFIVQACQGSKVQHISLDAPLPTTDSLMEYDYVGFPERGDAVIAWSTVKGYASFRDMFEGSWFIQELCNELRKNAHKNDFLEIVMTVNKNLRHKSHNGVIMVPCLTSSLSQKIQLAKF